MSEFSSLTSFTKISIETLRKLNKFGYKRLTERNNAKIQTSEHFLKRKIFRILKGSQQTT